MNADSLPTLSLSEIIDPESLSIENYGNERPTKVFLAGKHAGEPRRWSALYCRLRPEILAQVEPHLVDGTVGGLALVHQVAGENEGKLVAIASAQCGIGSHRVGIVAELGTCSLPAPFDGLDDLAR